ncbi:MAG: hypothetical protein WC284_13500 [Candidimonas sp.]
MNAKESAPSVLLLNADSPFARSIAKSLERAGYSPRRPGEAEAGQPSLAVLFPWSAPDAALQDVDIDVFVGGLESMLVDAGVKLRESGLRSGAASLSRLVVLSGWEAHGSMGRSARSAVAGAMLGLARSWALEFAPLGLTVNAVIPGPDFMAERDDASLWPQASIDGLAYAIQFFLDPRAQSISGQVIAVCGGRTPATIPV